MTGSDSFVSLPLKHAEAKILGFLTSRVDQLTSRDEIAQALWGTLWLEKYSDTVIDTLIYRIRKKLLSQFRLLTIRNRGFILQAANDRSQPHPAPDTVLSPPSCIFPPQSYIDYMNNLQNSRLTLTDLFLACQKINLPLNPTRTLVIDSYSSDNVDSAISYLPPSSQIFFSGFDERALELHRRRIYGLDTANINVVYDDIRASRLKTASFDLVVNDFRLNFNVNHKQNQQSLEHIHRILKPKGTALISVVIDARYESSRFGDNQQKAPLNIHAPWQFVADEKLPRYCYTVPYYQKLFTDSNFRIVQEFDREKGKTWAKKLRQAKTVSAPFFRRFVLEKI